MSRIGNAPVVVPSGVTIEQSATMVRVKGPKGELSFVLPPGVTIKRVDENLVVERKEESKKSKAIHGFIRAELANTITGVTQGWSRVLELSGVGYRASVSGANLVLTVGFSHPVTVTPPEGIAFSIVEGKIVVNGISKHMVGQTAANIREIKKPEPYKGKGIKYIEERIRKKAGKAKAVGGAGGAK